MQGAVRAASREPVLPATLSRAKHAEFGSRPRVEAFEVDDFDVGPSRNSL